jgi:hypothetical protein
MLNRYFIAASTVLLAGCFLSATIGLGQTPKPERELQQFLRGYLADPRIGIDKTIKYAATGVRLSESAKEDAVLVYITGQNWCGSGGCQMLVLEPEGSSYRVITRTTITQLPIRILRSTTNGRHDLGVWVQGGGVQPGYEAILSFNGKMYPNNPSMPPAKKSAGKAPGAIALSATTATKPLYSNSR